MSEYKIYDTSNFLFHEGNAPKEGDYIRARLKAWQALVNDHNLQDIVLFDFDKLYMELKMTDYFSECGFPLIVQPNLHTPITIFAFLELVSGLIETSKQVDIRISNLVSELHNEGIDFEIKGFNKTKFL